MKTKLNLTIYYLVSLQAHDSGFHNVYYSVIWK